MSVNEDIDSIWFGRLNQINFYKILPAEGILFFVSSMNYYLIYIKKTGRGVAWSYLIFPLI